MKVPKRAPERQGERKLMQQNMCKILEKTKKLALDRQTFTECWGTPGIGLLAFIPMLLCGLVTHASAGTWTEYSPASAPYAQVQAGSTQVWALDEAGDVYQYNSSTNAFDKITGNLVRIVVGTGNTVWGINGSGEVYQYSFSKGAFQKVAVSLGVIGVIAAGGQGVWGLSTSSITYEWDSVTKSFTKPPHGGTAGAIGLYVGSYGIGVWELDASNHAWLYNTDTDYFDETDGVLAQIAVGNDQVWGVTGAGTVWQYDVTTEKWIQPDPSASLVEIAAGSNNNIWGFNGLPGGVYLFDQTTQKFVNQNAESSGGSLLSLQNISVSSGTAGVWGVDIYGTIWKQ
jgi:hypothetical protein